LYSRGQRVLLVGEGDFTFALALAAAVGGGGIVATSFDSLSDVHSKYR
jgi:25S rRNA (uracil2634-N3)-methyltransferase